MTNYATMTRDRLTKRLTAVQAALDALYITRTASAAQNVESYSIDSGEGAQRVTRKKDKDMFDTIEQLESEELWLINQLRGHGLVSIQLRRRTPYDY